LKFHVFIVRPIGLATTRNRAGCGIAIAVPQAAIISRSLGERPSIEGPDLDNKLPLVAVEIDLPVPRFLGDSPVLDIPED